MNEENNEPCQLSPQQWERDKADRALAKLHLRAKEGDFEAIEAIVAIGNQVADILYYMRNFTHPSLRENLAMSMVAEHSLRWPVSVPAVEEIREATVAEHLPPKLGASTGIRVNKRTGQGNKRLFRDDSQTGIAFNAHCFLAPRIKAKLGTVPEINESTLETWADAGLKAIRDFPPIFPRSSGKIKSEIKQRMKQGQEEESAALYVARKMLIAGFRQLAKRPELQKRF